MDKNIHDMSTHSSSSDISVLVHDNGTIVQRPKKSKVDRTWSACAIYDKVHLSKQTYGYVLSTPKERLQHILTKNSIEFCSTPIDSFELCGKVYRLILSAKDWYCKYSTHIIYNLSILKS